MLIVSTLPSPKYLEHFFLHTKSSRANFKTQKATQALSVHRKSTFCTYIKCLIVISWKVMIQRRGSEKWSYFGILV